MNDPTTPPLPAYVLKLHALYQSGVLGHGQQHVAILHDPWCVIFLGKPCNCEPDIELLPMPDKAAQN